MLLLELLSLIFLTVVGGVQVQQDAGPLKYPLPQFSMKISILEEGLDLSSFQLELEKVTAMHVSANLREELPPTGPLGLDKFNEIELASLIVNKEPANETQNGPDGKRVVIDINFFKGYSVFKFHQNAPPEEAPFVLTAMIKLITQSFATTEEYSRLISKYMATTALQNIKGCVISIDNPDYNGPDDDDDEAGNINDGNTALKRGVTAAVVLVLLSLLGALVYYYFVIRKRRQTRILSKKRSSSNRPSSARNGNDSKKLNSSDGGVETDDDCEDAQSDESGAQEASPLSPLEPASDRVLDEWTQKLTSIPLTLTGIGNSISMMSKPKQRRPMPRPALQSKKTVCLNPIEEVSESASDMSSVADLSQLGSFKDIESSLGLTGPNLTDGGGGTHQIDKSFDSDDEENNDDEDDYSFAGSGRHHSRIVV